ncbi:MAG: hypothetical protein FJW86_04585 [Actinobacteria bacterium]|nr:hypothetical protein [Actinomycetota bacterium]
MDFYGDVLLELITATGAALFAANAFALFKRRGDRQRAAREAVQRARPGSPVRGQVKVATTGTLSEVPVGRSVAYMLLGLLVFLWGLATITS